MSETVARSAPPQMAARRCWRCLQMFPAARHVPTRESFWLCDPCATAPVPSRPRRS